MALPYTVGADDDGTGDDGRSKMEPERVQKIEEAVSFAEQRSDDLDSAIRDVADRLEKIFRRLDRLEQRLVVLEAPGEAGEAGAAQAGDPADERPPHSGKLPGDR